MENDGVSLFLVGKGSCDVIFPTSFREWMTSPGCRENIISSLKEWGLEEGYQNDLLTTADYEMKLLIEYYNNKDCIFRSRRPNEILNQARRVLQIFITITEEFLNFSNSIGEVNIYNVTKENIKLVINFIKDIINWIIDNYENHLPWICHQPIDFYQIP